DNTYSAGLAFKPFEHGVDISVQALTKYQSGGSDVLMGATITANAELHAQLKLARMRCGIGVSVDDCSLVLRSLPSLQVRFD
ncbi:PLP-dependent transferase, partial [Paraburkholderia sp. SIMBA_009]